MASKEKRERLLRKAAQVLGSVAGTGVLAATLTVPASAQSQYAVSDAQLQTNVTTALHNDAKLNGSEITANTAQGVVTLSGNVSGEDARVEAEQVVAGVSGVRSIQDNIHTPGNVAAPASAPAPAQNKPEPMGSVPPPPSPESGTAASGMPPEPPADQPTSRPGTQQENPSYTPYPNGSAPAPTAQNGYPNQNPGGYNNYPNQNPNQNPGDYNNYPQQPGYGTGSYGTGGYGPRGNTYPPRPTSTFAVTPQQQDTSGPVTIPAGTLLSVRTTQPLSTNNLKGGEYFQVTAATDVYANGVLAIPRGAVLTGQVVEAKNAGALGGTPKLDLRLTSLQLGPSTYPLASETWSSQGPSKSGYTATNTVGGAAAGALIGAIAGGGVGAGVGAIAGGATGVLVSGATHGPRLDLPPEALLQFHLEQPLTVQPVPYAEAEQLAASAPQQPVLRQRPVYVTAPYYRAPYPYVVRPYPYGVRAYPYPYAYYYPRY